MAEVVEGTGAVPAWFGDTGEKGEKPHRTGEYSRSPQEWMPRPWDGRIMVKRNVVESGTVYVQVVPGPEGLWQIVRIELNQPVARGFRTPGQARRWVHKAVGAGILPQRVVLVEPYVPPVSDP